MSSTDNTSRITGKVKWFNSKAGYGFITVCEGELVDKDVFVHYSSIKADSSQYKYLTQGEYVDFTLTKPANEKHEYHAVEVTGVKGGLIMCETRRLSSIALKSGDSEAVAESPVEDVNETSRASSAPRKFKTREPKESKESDGFTTVKRSRPPVKKTGPPAVARR